MDETKLHKTQVSILDTLRHVPSERFTVLMKPTGHTSDTFKFHIRKLIKSGLVEKLESGEYTLTAKGKEFANNIDADKRMRQKQPKISLLLVVRKKNEDGQDVYLFQKRLRSPYREVWGFLSGPVRWGVDAEDGARNELLKQTGLLASFKTAYFCRQKDFLRSSDTLLEDKIFQVMVANDAQGEIREWSGGMSRWMTVEELHKQEKSFQTTDYFIDLLDCQVTYGQVDMPVEAANY